jgi:hypothetical protein
MENSFATIIDTLYSYRIQLSMPFHSYDFSISIIFLSYESKEPWKVGTLAASLQVRAQLGRKETSKGDVICGRLLVHGPLYWGGGPLFWQSPVFNLIPHAFYRTSSLWASTLSAAA